jgi:hypothetical protein
MALCATAALIILSCSTTLTQDRWKDENYNNKLSKILVIGMSKDVAMRQLFEDTLADQLKQRGVEAVPSLTFLEPDTEITRDNVKPKIDGMGFDGAIVTHLVSMDAIDRYIPVRRTVPHTTDYFNNMYSYYSQTYPVVYTKDVAVQEEVAVLETALFDVKSENRVWKMTSQTFKPRRDKKTVKDIAREIVSNLRLDKLI